jgi:hypothetical protein
MMTSTHIRQCGAVLAVAATFVASGCVHTNDGPRYASASVAKRLGVPHCRVSLPISQSEVLLNAKRDGDAHPETREEWAKIVATSRPGDELRKVVCIVHGYHGDAGDMYFGLFRDGALIDKFEYTILN